MLLLLRTLLLLALIACAGCDSIAGIFGSRATLALPGRRDSLDDPNELAGLRIVLDGAVSDSFVASDLPVAPFGVPGSGTVHISVSLSQGSRVVAQREAEWELIPDADRWELEVVRSDIPVGAVVNPEEIKRKTQNPECGWFWCHRVWRVEIAEDARNFEDEVLWLILWMYDGKCADLCP